MTKVIVLSRAANITSKEFTALETTITNVVYYKSIDQAGKASPCLIMRCVHLAMRTSQLKLPNVLT